VNKDIALKKEGGGADFSRDLISSRGGERRHWAVGKAHSPLQRRQRTHLSYSSILL